MTFIFKVKYFDEDKNTNVESRGLYFCEGDKFSDAANALTNWFGADNLYQMDIYPIEDEPIFFIDAVLEDLISDGHEFTVEI